MRSSIQPHEPLTLGVVLIVRARSTFARSGTSVSNCTRIGMPTPTTSWSPGYIDASSKGAFVVAKAKVFDARTPSALYPLTVAW